MPVSGDWFGPGVSRIWLPRLPGSSLNATQEKDRVIHGRIAKATAAHTTSKSLKYNHHGIEGSEGGIKGKFKDIKQEEKDDSDLGNGNEKGEGSAIKLPMTMKPPMKSQESDSENSEFFSPKSSQHSDDNDTDSEPDPDTAWRLEQIYINMTLNARNEFSLMPSTWKMHFRGIPLPNSLFYKKGDSKSRRPRIYALKDRLEYRGARTLRGLIDIHARIQDIRDDESMVKNDAEKTDAQKRGLMKSLSAEIVKQLRRTLDQALDWAKQDGDLDRYGDQLPPNIKIMELNVITVTDEPESETKIQTEMSNLARDWRKRTANADVKVQVPVLFGFVIIKHIITIVTLDASDQGAIIHVPCQLHMAEKNQHQWNALAIMATICWARDVLVDYINARPDLQPEAKSESSDPDA